MDQTPTQRLAQTLLGQDLRTWVLARRAERKSWRIIARDLRDATDGSIDVTDRTLLNWYGDDDRTEALSA